MPTSRPRTVLVVEDESDLREAIVHVLNQSGWNVLFADNGTSGLQLIDSDYEAVVVDMMLPGASGFQIVQAVRARKGESLPIIMMSGNREDAHRDYALQLGITDFIQKPFGVYDLAKLLETFVPVAE